MKKYIIYDMQTDEVLGIVEANSIIDAEIKGSEKFDRPSDALYALSETLLK